MRRPFALFVLIPLACAASAARAETPAAEPAATTPGAVSQFLFSQEMLELGLSRNDAVAVLGAARLAAAVKPQDADRAPEPSGESVPPTYPDARFMFTAAKALAKGDETLTDLAAKAETAPPPTLILNRSSHGIKPDEEQTFTLPFFGGVLAEVGLLGDGKSNLDLTVTDKDGTAVCVDTAPGDRALCRFAPAENAKYKITILNSGVNPATYSLLTE